MKRYKTKEDVESMSPNQLVSWFMVGCYAYYVLHKNIMLDETFDYLVQRLKEEYDNSDHDHKRYITQDMLNSYTGFDIAYPMIVKHATVLYLKENGLWD